MTTTNMAVTANELTVLRHCLGLNRDGGGQACRNYYVSGAECLDMPLCQRLVGRGLMIEAGKIEFCTRFDRLFTITDAGRDVVAAAQVAQTGAPNVCRAGEIAVVNGCKDVNSDCWGVDAVHVCSQAMVVQFPDTASLRAAMETGNIPPCTVLGMPTRTEVRVVAPGVEIRVTAAARKDMSVVGWLNATAKSGRAYFARENN